MISSTPATMAMLVAVMNVSMSSDFNVTRKLMSLAYGLLDIGRA